MVRKLLTVGVLFMLVMGIGLARTTVEIWSWRTQDAAVWEEVQKILDQQNAGVQLSFHAFIPTEYDAKMVMALQGGQGPDIAYTRRLPGGRTEGLVTSGLVLPLEDRIDFSNFADGVISNATLDGRVYGVPFAVQVTGIFYNKDMFDRYGLAEPRTWDELIQVSETLKKNGINPFFIMGREAWTLTMQHAMTGVSILGPEWIKDLAEGKRDFLDPDWIHLQKLMNDLKVYFQPGFMGNDSNDMNAAFAFEDAAMVFYGVWGMQMWRELNPDINVGYFMVPPLREDQEPYAYVYMDGMISLTSNSRNPEAAMKVLEITATPEFGTIFSNITTNIPGVMGAQMPDDPILMETNYIAENHASPYVYWVGSQFVVGNPSLYDGVLSPGMQEMFAGRITPEELAQRAQDALSQWFEPLMKRLGK